MPGLESIRRTWGNWAGVSRQTISLIERGDYSPSGDAGFEAGEDLSGDSEDIFTYTEDGEDE
mgnify:CR=1 FL=1